MVIPEVRWESIVLLKIIYKRYFTGFQVLDSLTGEKYEIKALQLFRMMEKGRWILKLFLLMELTFNQVQGLWSLQWLKDNNIYGFTPGWKRTVLYPLQYAGLEVDHVINLLSPILLLTHKEKPDMFAHVRFFFMCVWNRSMKFYN